MTEWEHALQGCQNCERGLDPRNTVQEGKPTGKTVGLPPLGAKILAPCTYMIVRSQPAWNKNESTAAFSDPSGEKFVKWLEKKVGFPVQDTFLTNLVKCAIKNDDVTNVPTYYFRRCKGWFYAELGLVMPKVIIALGKVTWEVLGGEFDRFTLLSDPFNWGHQYTVYGTWTPDYVDRNRDKVDDYTTMFYKVMKWVEELKVNKKKNLPPL